MNIISWLLLVIAGHIFGAYVFYFFHRYIFHGSLGDHVLLRSWKNIHTMHHARPEDPSTFFFPVWASILIWSLTIACMLVSPPFFLGVMSFFPVYSYRHRKSHMGHDSTASKHHMSHHNVKPRANFSGTYPFIDKVFGTYEPVLARVKRD
tara:strand:- start:3583 stop:4032 length:450 start_codon:yes stop_codon:yes gene_type:complete